MQIKTGQPPLLGNAFFVWVYKFTVYDSILNWLYGHCVNYFLDNWQKQVLIRDILHELEDQINIVCSN